MIGELFRYGAVGLANTAIGYAAIFSFMRIAGASPEVSNALGFAIGLSVSYVLNRIYTFRSREVTGRTLPRFLAAFVLAYTANFGVLRAALLLGVTPEIAQIPAVVTFSVCFFLLCRIMVFRDRAS